MASRNPDYLLCGSLLNNIDALRALLFAPSRGTEKHRECNRYLLVFVATCT